MECITQNDIIDSLNHTLLGEHTIVENCWDELTLAQQFSASSIGQFGYHLSFVRCSEHQRTAVFSLGDKIATISATGVINMSPNIKLRAQERG